MSVLVTLEMPVKPDMLEEYLGILKGALVETREYEGCMSVKTYVDRETSAVLLVEEWETAEHQQSYMAWRVETGLIEAVAPFMQGELSIRTFDPKSDV
tara:strand:- start:107310 stop:107603 length:294 start_codon:yes stop_codon:yes gene_type:complete